MPTYEYECTKCGYNFEAFQSIKEKALEECPECGKEVRRLIGSGAGIIFKGTGFYCTDFKNKSSAVKKPAVKSAPNQSESQSKTENTTKNNKETAK